MQAIKVEGITRTQRALAQLSEEVRDGLLGIIEEGAKIAEREAKAIAPQRSGELARSISTRVLRDGLVRTVGTKLFYAPFNELGTSRQPATPFLRPAFLVAAQYVRPRVYTLTRGLGRARMRKGGKFKPRASDE